MPNATAIRVLFTGDRARGVEVLREGKTTKIGARQVVLSAGTFGSAELLLRSGVGPAAGLKSLGIPCVADLPGVGQNLRCHPMLTLHFPSSCAPSVDPDSPRLVLVHSASERNNLMLFPRQLEQGLAIMVTLRLPASSGELCLRSADPFAPPAIRYGYLAPGDLRRLREGLHLSLELARRAQPGGGAAAAEITHDWILEHLETADHACGTCKLGPPDDPLAVVDDQCRVRAVAGLRVVDLSIVPRSVRAGPYPTVVMLAERAADLMCQRTPSTEVGGAV